MFGQKLKPTKYRTKAEEKAMAGDIPVFCSHDAIIPIETLKPNPKNPNHHPDSQIQLLGQIIKSNGWRAPITVSNQSGYIVKGHGRLEAALAAGLTLAPVDYQNYASESEEMADLAADNRLAELSSMDGVMLADLLVELQENGDIPTILTGYDEEDIEALLKSLEEDEEEFPELESLPPTLPLCEAGDMWNLGEHRLIIADSSDEELHAADQAIRAYVEETGNLLCTCTRDEEVHEYMELIKQWAEENQEEDILEEKIPVIKRRK